MRQSITQEFEYGCGIACFAFALKSTYKEATYVLGCEQSASHRFWVKDLVHALNKAGIEYSARRIKPGSAIRYEEGDIVLLRRSKRYPVGHYLIRHNNMWMDPWVDMVTRKYDMSCAKSGYRKRLPGKAMYILSNA